MRQLLALVVAALACNAAPPALAQGGPFPNKAVHLLVGAPPGGSNDVIARAIAQKMGDTLGQQVVVDNRPGAGSMLAAGMVAKSPADGYTLFMTNSSISFAPSMYDKLPFDPLKDFASGGEVGRMPLVVIINKSLPVNSLQELVALVRARPNSVNFGSGGSGSPQHLAGELLKSLTGVQMSHVPYKGTGPAMTDLIGGQIQMLIEPLASALPQIKADRVRALAVTGAQRSASLPDIPTSREAGFAGLEVTAWYGLLAASGTPPDVMAKINTALNRALTDPATKANLQMQGIDVTPGAPQVFTSLIATEIARWKPVIQNAGIKAD